MRDLLGKDQNVRLEVSEGLVGEGPECETGGKWSHTIKLSFFHELVAVSQTNR